MANPDPFVAFIDSLDQDESVYSYGDMENAWHGGANCAKEAARRTIEELKDQIADKDAALEAARDLINEEQQTLCEPDGTLGTQYESVLALISKALV